MRKIYKYPIPIEGTTILLPHGAFILDVIEQFDEIVLYAMVDANKPATILHKVVVEGTGWALTADSTLNKYYGTVSTHGGMYVWHVFVA